MPNYRSRLLSLTVSAQTYELLLTLALMTKEPISALAVRVLESNLAEEINRAEKIHNYLAANRTETQIYRTKNMETKSDNLEDGVAYEEDTLVKEALQRWQILEETEAE